MPSDKKDSEGCSAFQNCVFTLPSVASLDLVLNFQNFVDVDTNLFETEHLFAKIWSW